MGGYHDLHTTLQITHTDTRRVTIRTYNNQQDHVVGFCQLFVYICIAVGDLVIESE